MLLVVGTVPVVRAVARERSIAGSPFIVGAPGRRDSDSDRRLPRRYDRDDSLLVAYADIDVVSDPTWLVHEVESYARRALACESLGSTGCQRETRRVGTGYGRYVAAGLRAEIVWVARESRAVRVGWRRVVATPGGTMTVDTPPERFFRSVVDEYPSALPAAPPAGAAWAEAEVDRLLYYLDHAAGALSTMIAPAARRHAEWFIATNLSHVRRVRAMMGAMTAGTDSMGVDGPAAPVTWIEEVESIRRWRAESRSRPWCSAEPATVPPALSLAGPP